MKNILQILLLILIAFILGCSKDAAQDQITGDVVGDRVEIVDRVVTGPIEEEIEKEEEEVSTIRICHDTDNGIIRWVNGAISGFTDKAERFEFSDYCLDEHILVEHYCENEAAQNVSFECKNGCVNAHCV